MRSVGFDRLGQLNRQTFVPGTCISSSNSRLAQMSLHRGSLQDKIILTVAVVIGYLVVDPIPDRHQGSSLLLE